MAKELKRIAMIKARPGDKSAKLTPKENPAIRSEGPFDTVYVCPVCDDVLIELAPGYDLRLLVQCAKRKTVSERPESASLH